MKIAIAQLNVTVGDLDGNAAKIMDAARRARADGVSLLLTTELVLCGYPPEDLLLRDDFFRACDQAFQRIVREVTGITLVLG
ncbi:MAG: synthetase, partial [Proteobacteria bacterium]|nr:synthetase [Pseudomonadota bacterium]